MIGFVEESFSHSRSAWSLGCQENKLYHILGDGTLLHWAAKVFSPLILLCSKIYNVSRSCQAIPFRKHNAIIRDIQTRAIFEHEVLRVELWYLMSRKPLTFND